MSIKIYGTRYSEWCLGVPFNPNRKKRFPISYFEYRYYNNGNPYDLINEACDTWRSYDILLAASPTVENGWRCTTVGLPDLSHIR